MAPHGNRQATKERAERAWRLHCAGRTWQEVADELGFKSRQSALVTVKRLLAKEPPEDVLMQRATTAGGYRIIKGKLFATLAVAKDPHAVVAVSRALADVMDKHARLVGLHVVVPQEINLHVQQTVSAVIDRAEDDLLQAIESGGAPAVPEIIDAEIVEAQAP